MRAGKLPLPAAIIAMLEPKYYNILQESQLYKLCSSRSRHLFTYMVKPDIELFKLNTKFLGIAETKSRIWLIKMANIFISLLFAGELFELLAGSLLLVQLRALLI